ncbi:uncharacterized protein LOC116201055 [Punica granatum]|uniref:Uncharacterized protein LOC116201055 n=1 Tax=Punica granatum TaxID=22663 RepID=A0A218WLP6_PUNGR|nr:uncharacterized protein LOC116201055 [Punica granatum]OWM73556.1 hypothetical protein CDL15_Pgr026655 [Punica granatum]
MHGKKKKDGSVKPAADAPVTVPTIREIRKDVQYLVNQHTLWKDKNQQEREKIAQLGGRKPKGEKRTLAVHLQMTKKKRERERRQLQKNLKHGLSGGNSWDASHSLTTTKSGESKHKPKDRALKCTAGHFRGGVLNVKNLLQPNSSSREGRDNTIPTAYSRKGKKRKGGGKKKGKGGR